MGKYGDFSADGSEYIITRPDTPRPWINYLTNGDYCALCSHRGGGFSFYRDHRFHAVLRRGSQVHLDDLPARLVYLKDETDGAIWTANVFPGGRCDTFEARHGMGYTTFISAYRGIETKTRFFVPPDIDAELWEITFRNEGRTARRLSLYTYAEFSLGNVPLELAEGRFAALFNEAVHGEREMIFRKKWWHTTAGWSEHGREWPHRVYLVTTESPAAMLSSREDFLGAFRGYADPVALQGEVMPSANGSGKDLAGVYQWRFELAPGESRCIQMAIGIQSDADTEAERRIRAELKLPASHAAAWARTQAYWSGLFDAVKVETPDRDINHSINYWNKLQLMINFHFGRGPSYYHAGQYPAMRDSCQDAFGAIPLAPELAKANLRRIAGFFYADGRACGGCNRIGLPEEPSDKVDLPLWLIPAAASYIKETGDLAFLDESIPLMDGGESTIYQKMTTGIARLLDERGPHGLPLIGKGDWNDAANMIGAGGSGESVWLAQFLCFALSEIEPFLRLRGDLEKLATYARRAEELREIINRDCWDGGWFIRAFKDDGSPVGTKSQKEGRIWINSQTWAVIAGIADRERLEACLDAVDAHLGTAYGLMNLAPAFTDFDPTIGIITGFRPGWKENGAVFSHASAFNVVARCLLGRGKDAVDLFRRILLMGKDSDRYLLEPYVYAQFCAGPDSGGSHGTGAYHWLSGTAAWMFRAMLDYILGVRPELDGLRIAPAVDPDWRSFSVRRAFRGATYEIVFANPDGVAAGVKEIRLDGELIAGDLLPLPTRERHLVEVIMG